MTGRFLRVPIMRPYRCWAVLHVSILAGLLLTLNADSEDSGCEGEVKVTRNTIYGATLGEDLEIHCNVTFCNNSPPTVTWYKLENTSVPLNFSSSSHIKTEWQHSNHLEGKSILIFQKILRSDSSLYQCKIGDMVSHTIKVTVLDYDDDGHTNVTQKNYTTVVPEPIVDLWIYMYVAAGIVAFVVIVIIISVVSMRGCKGKPKKETPTENQYIAIPMAEQPFPQTSPRGSPSAPPSRSSARRKAPPSQPDELPLPRGNEQVCGKVKEDEGGSVVYAALNHQLRAGGAARPRRPKEEESSEYAAIRVKDPSLTGLNYY